MHTPLTAAADAVDAQPALPPAVLFVQAPDPVLRFDLGAIGQAGLRTLVVLDADEAPGAVGPHVDETFVADFSDPATLGAVRGKIAASYSVAAVVGFSEVSVFPAAMLAEGFGVRGIGRDVARRCRDKLAMIEALSGAGARVPRWFVAETDQDLAPGVAAIGGFPVVCKPLMGFASFGVIRADDAAALEHAVRLIRRDTRFVMQRYRVTDHPLTWVLVESFVPGEEIAVDGFVHAGRTSIIAVIDKPNVSQGPYFGDGLHVLPSRLGRSLMRQLEQTVQQSISAIGLDDSPFHLEARINQGEIHVLELAARIGFSRSIRDALGIDICAVTVALKLGQRPDAHPTRHRFAGNYCMNAHKFGRFRAIANRDQILADPVIVDMPVFVKPGQRVAPAPIGNNYVGYILAAADSYEAVEKALTAAAARVDVVID